MLPNIFQTQQPPPPPPPPQQQQQQSHKATNNITSVMKKRVSDLDEASSLVVENSDLLLKKQQPSPELRRKARRPIEVVIPAPVSTTKRRRVVQTFEPPPIFTTTTVFAFGAFIVILANIWTPLALLFVWCAARLQRYCFRINDEPSARRRMLREFQRKDVLTAPLRQIPCDVKVEESYWVNRRYVNHVLYYCARSLEFSGRYGSQQCLVLLFDPLSLQGHVINDEYHHTERWSTYSSRGLFLSWIHGLSHSYETKGAVSYGEEGYCCGHDRI